MVVFPKLPQLKINSEIGNIISSECIKDIGTSNNNIKHPSSSFFGNIWKNILDFFKNAVISAYDQRKLPFISKLKNGFSIMNVFTIVKTIFYSYREGKTLFEITKDVAYECLKIFAGITLCHFTTSIMESFVNFLLNSSLKGIILGFCGSIGFPPAPLLLFLFDILIAWLGGKCVDLIRYFYNKYLKHYVHKACNWIKEKVKSAWNWFKGLFK